jgi:hypothetical protein
MAGADALAFPFLMDQPVARRVAELRGDEAKRFGRDEARGDRERGRV